ncbi:MAG: hypothetical protein ACYTFW_17390 [Planctomycetota bacterium]|jgi:hypothetical protein
MTIQFNCPNCDALIAFDDKYCGKRARCTTCGQPFIIPSKDKEAPKKIKLPKEKGEPLPGFYRAVLIDSWKLFTNPKNATGLVFILTVVVFKFFTAGWNFSLFIQGNWLSFDFYIPLGWVLRAAAWGCLFWFYTEMIYSTGFDREEMPVVTLGGFYGLIWKIVKSIYTIFIILLVVGMPYIIAFLILKKMQIQSPVFLYISMLGGLFLLPMAILTVAVGKELTMLRYDYLLIPIFRAFTPYLVTVVLLGVAVIVQIQTKQYAHQDQMKATGYLLLNFALQAVFVIAMRSVGLFYRHYSCHLSW